MAAYLAHRKVDQSESRWVAATVDETVMLMVAHLAEEKVGMRAEQLGSILAV